MYCELKMNFSSFCDSFFVRYKGGVWSCLVTRVQGAHLLLQHRNPAPQAVCALPGLPHCQPLCIPTYVNNVNGPAHSDQCEPGVTSLQSVSHPSDKRVSLTAEPGSVDLNRSGCNLGDVLCAAFMGESLWQEMPSGVSSTTEPHLIFHVCQCFPWTSWQFPALSIRCTIVGEDLCAMNNSKQSGQIAHLTPIALDYTIN